MTCLPWKEEKAQVTNFGEKPHLLTALPEHVLLLTETIITTKQLEY